MMYLSKITTLPPEIQNFLDDKDNLNIMNHAAKGIPLDSVAEETEKEPSFVQEKIKFLKDHRIMVQGRWNVNVNALGMMKTFAFYRYSESGWDRIIEDNFFLSYLAQVEMGLTRYFAMFTFPKKEAEKKIGTEISSWYYTPPHFNEPFIRKEKFEEEFEKFFENEDNKSPFPSRDAKIQNPDLIDIYICRYIQITRSDIDLEKYTEKMKEEIGDLVDIDYHKVEKKLEKMMETNVIYHINPFLFYKLSYSNVYFITEYNQIYRFMKALAKLNIVSAISFIKNNKYILYIHCPSNKKDSIANVLSNRDRKSQMFSVLNTYRKRGIPYKYYLEKYKKNSI